MKKCGKLLETCTTTEYVHSTNTVSLLVPVIIILLSAHEATLTKSATLEYLTFSSASLPYCSQISALSPITTPDTQTHSPQ